MPALGQGDLGSVDVVGRNGDRWQVGQEIVQQDLLGGQGQEGQDRGRQGHAHHVAEVRAGGDADVLQGVGEGTAALSHARAEHLEIALQQDHVRAVSGDVDRPFDRDADVGGVQGRSVVDAVAHVADGATGSLQRPDDALFLLRVDLHEQVGSPDSIPECLVLQSGDLFAGDHRLRVEPDAAGHVCRDVAVVTGDDLDSNAQLGQVFDRVPGVWPRRVEEEQKAPQAHLRLVAANVLFSRRDTPRCERQHPKTLRAPRAEIGVQPFASGVVHGDLAAFLVERGTDSEHLREGALGDHPVMAAVLGRGGHDREALADEVIRDLIDLLPAVGGEPFPRPGRHQRLVQGVFDARLEGRVEVGEAENRVRVPEVQVDCGLQSDAPLGEGAGLVRAEDIHAAQILDRFQPPDDHPAPCHGARPVGEGHAHDGGQQLRRNPHGQGHPVQQRFDGRPVQPVIDGQHEHHHQEHDADEKVPELSHASGELGFRWPRLQLPGDGAEGRVQTCLHDQHRRRATAHGRAEEYAVRPGGQGCLRWHDTGTFLHRQGFAGETRLGHQEVPRLEDEPVRGNQVARGKLDHVARDDGAGADRSGRAVAAYLCGQGQSATQPGNRGGCPVFLDEPEQGAAGHDGENDCGVDPVAGDDGNGGAEDEDQHQRTLELAQQEPGGGPPGLLVERVGSVLPEPLRGGRGGQSLRAAPEVVHHHSSLLAPVGGARPLPAHDSADPVAGVAEEPHPG